MGVKNDLQRGQEGPPYVRNDVPCETNGKGESTRMNQILNSKGGSPFVVK